MAMRPIDWKLCLIADTEFVSGRDIFQLTKEAAEAGVTLVQLRAKNLCSRDFLDLALKLSEYLRNKGLPFIINDRVEIALSCGATGVHLGQEDLPLPFAREILGKDKLIGISVHSLEEALTAEKGGADYLGVGPVYYTSTKRVVKSPLGLEGLKAIKERIRIPILAIGGINARNAAEVMACGADGVVVISSILGSEDIHKAAKELIAAITAKT